MAVNDIRSNLQETLAFLHIFTGNEVKTGFTIDTANFELGLMFDFLVTVRTVGDFSLALFESDDSGMSGEVAITGDKLIGTLPTAVAVATAEGAILPTVGVISNLRYVRVTVTGANSSAGTVAVIATQKAENMPV